MMIRNKPAYSFDDVLLVPQHSKITSRQDTDLSTSVGRNLRLTLPILSSNMDTVTEVEMAMAMADSGGGGVLHRFASQEDQALWLQNLRSSAMNPRIISVGLEGNEKREVFDDIVHLVGEYGVDAICLDVAHGDHVKVLEMLNGLRFEFPAVDIIAGNVATGRAACRLVDAGANVIKVGIGPGSVCSTRVVSGHGFPQLSAIIEVDQELRLAGRREGDINQVSVIADGGIRYPGDIVKALAAGADAVMLGSLLAGTDEAAGDRIVEDGIAFKTFRGMASREAQTQKRAGRTPRVEGVAARIPYRGPVRDTLANLEAGIRSGFSYSGASSLTELRDAAEFVVVTNNTLRESHPRHTF